MADDQRRLVLVVDTDQRFIDEARAVLADQRVLTVQSLAEATEVVLGGRVDLVILGPAYASDIAVSQAHALLGADPAVHLALVADVVTNRLLKSALRGGFADVIATPLQARDVADLLHQLPTRSEVAVSVESSPIATAAVPQPPHEPESSGTPADVVFYPAQQAPPVAPAGVGFVVPSVPTPQPAPAPYQDPAPAPVAPVYQAPAPQPAPAPYQAPAPQPVAPVYQAPYQAPASGAGQVEHPASSPLPAAYSPDTMSAPESSAYPTDPAPPAELAQYAPPPVAPTPAQVVAPVVSRPSVGLPSDDLPSPPSRSAVLDQVLPPPPSSPPPSGRTEKSVERPAAPQNREQDRVQPRAPRPGDGRVIAVTAGKGGSGKTVVATNLAIALGMRHDPERVAIVDADLQFGDVALLLQIDPVRTLDDVVGRLDAMSDERLDAALLRHESGIRVLPAPILPVSEGDISAKQIVEVVGRMRSMFDVIVVDTGPVFDDGLVTLLDYADDVVTVVDMDLPSVKNAKVALDRLRQGGFDVEKVRLVVNRVNSKARLDLVELERSLGLRVGGSVPSDRLVPQSVNEGIPVLALSPRSKVARAFHALAESLDPEATRGRLTGR